MQEHLRLTFFFKNQSKTSFNQSSLLAVSSYDNPVYILLMRQYATYYGPEKSNRTMWLVIGYINHRSGPLSPGPCNTRISQKIKVRSEISFMRQELMVTILYISTAPRERSITHSFLSHFVDLSPRLHTHVLKVTIANMSPEPK